MTLKTQLCSTDIHVRLLYIITLLLTAMVATTVWVGYSELKQLKLLLDDKISKSEVVDSFYKSASFSDVPILPSSWSVQTHTSPSKYGVNPDQTRKSTRERRQLEESSALPNQRQWAWLRTSLVALKSFCIETKEYCSANGPAGPPGIPGIKGDKGNSGFPGVAGSPGQKGESVDPDLVARNLRSDEYMRGPPGPKGDVGPMGDIGPQGPNGPPGTSGDMGNRGVHGFKGKDGIPGKPGQKGEIGGKGTRGLLGFPGFKGSPGPGGPMGPSGKIGTPGNDGIDGLPGIPGVPGTNGTDGLIGKRGKRGDKGEMAERGERGTSGVPGVPGLKGRKGDTGDRGWPGDKGECFCGMADTGPRGPRGSKGDKGDRGFCEVHCADSLRKLPSSTLTTTTTTEATTTPIPTIPPRTKYCRIKMIGKPFFERHAGSVYGCWMKDAAAISKIHKAKIWATFGNFGEKLYEYNSMVRFKQDRPDKVYNLGNIPFHGSGHVVYRNCFYYQAKEWNKMVQFDLSVGSAVTMVDLPGSAFKNERFLYKSVNNYYDFAVDENGLWVIYAKQRGSNKIHIAKLDPRSLGVMKSWKLDIERGTFGNGIILCGIAYFITSIEKTSSRIDYAFDIYTEKAITQFEALKFANPYNLNVMVSYNPSDNKIYGWDNGKQILYPLLIV